MIQGMAQKDNISWVHCTPRHHKTIGNIERTDRTLWMMLRELCAFGGSKLAKMRKKLHLLLIFRTIGF
jgi:hypothetical protein